MIFFQCIFQYLVINIFARDNYNFDTLYWKWFLKVFLAVGNTEKLVKKFYDLYLPLLLSMSSINNYQIKYPKNCCVCDVGRRIIAYLWFFYLFITRVCFPCSSLKIPSNINTRDQNYNNHPMLSVLRKKYMKTNSWNIKSIFLRNISYISKKNFPVLFYQCTSHS